MHIQCQTMLSKNLCFVAVLVKGACSVSYKGSLQLPKRSPDSQQLVATWLTQLLGL